MPLRTLWRLGQSRPGIHAASEFQPRPSAAQTDRGRRRPSRERERGYDKTGKGLCEMADREERREREGYGNDVMKVYEGGTVAAAASARRGEEDGKKCQEQKFSYIRHRSRHHHFLPLRENGLAFVSFFLNASSYSSTLAQ